MKATTSCWLAVFTLLVVACLHGRQPNSEWPRVRDINSTMAVELLERSIAKRHGSTTMLFPRHNEVSCEAASGSSLAMCRSREMAASWLVAPPKPESLGVQGLRLR